MSELGIYKLTEKNQINKSNWLQQVGGMEDYRLPKCILDYMPLERRGLGRERKEGQLSRKRPDGLCFEVEDRDI
jgi:hypothetical protein